MTLKDLFFNTFENTYKRDKYEELFNVLKTSGVKQLETELNKTNQSIIESLIDKATKANLLNEFENDYKNPFDYDIFISYNWGAKKENKEKAVRLKNALETENYKVWLDQRNLHGSTLYGPIADGIKKSGIFLCLISELYCQSHNCKTEFYWSIRNRKAFIPILIEPWGKISQEIQININPYFYLDMSDSNQHHLNDNWDNLRDTEFFKETLLTRIKIEIEEVKKKYLNAQTTSQALVVPTKYFNFMLKFFTL